MGEENRTLSDFADAKMEKECLKTDKESCCFYERKHTPLGDYYVCNHSKTVLASAEEKTFEETCNAIHKFLSVVQEKRLALKDSLHELAQQHDSGGQLSANDQEFYDKMRELCDIFTDLMLYGVIDIDSKGVLRQQKNIISHGTSSALKEAIYTTLYRLLMISEWLKEKFGIEE